MKHAILFLCLILAASPAFAKPEIKRAEIYNGYMGAGGQYEESAPYKIIDDDKLDNQCKKIVARDPDSYRLEGMWHRVKAYGGDDIICEAAGKTVYMKKGDSHVFCAPKCPEINNVNGSVYFSGYVSTVN